MTKAARSVFLEINEVKFFPRRVSEPDELRRFLTLHDSKVKENEEKELLAEITGVETREEQQKRKLEHLRSTVSDSSFRPASLPPPRRLEEEDEELPSFEDGYYIKKREFRRHFRKHEQVNWSSTNLQLIHSRKLRREAQRQAEIDKRNAEEQAKQLEQELKET
jgi:hypothetical protein